MSHVKLDEIELIKVVRENDTGPIKESRSITSAKISGTRNIVAHKIPGMEGGIVQDLGRDLRRMEFEGVISGPEAKNIVQTLWEKFYAGEPVSFESDIAGTADINLVVIEDLQISKVEGRAETYNYYLKLREYIPPPEPEEEEPEAEDEEASEETKEEAEKARDSYNKLVGRVVDDEGNPISNVKVIARGEEAEYSAITDENGEYVIENLEPGEYEVFVEGYEEEKRIVRIPSEKAGEAGIETPSAPGEEKVEKEISPVSEEGPSLEEFLPEEVSREKEELEKRAKEEIEKAKEKIEAEKEKLEKEIEEKKKEVEAKVEEAKEKIEAEKEKAKKILEDTKNSFPEF